MGSRHEQYAGHEKAIVDKLQSKYSRARDAFKKFDVRGDGKISVEELRSVLARVLDMDLELAIATEIVLRYNAAPPGFAPPLPRCLPRQHPPATCHLPPATCHLCARARDARAAALHAPRAFGHVCRHQGTARALSLRMHVAGPSRSSITPRSAPCVSRPPLLLRAAAAAAASISRPG